MAEREGFEPSIPLARDTAFRERLLQPLETPLREVVFYLNFFYFPIFYFPHILLFDGI